MLRPLMMLAAGSLLAGCATGPEASEDRRADDLDAYFSALTELGDFNGVVAAARDGEIVHLAAYNLPRDDVPSLRVLADSQFDMRSVSKLVAKAAVLKLEAEGRINREAPIGRYLPDFAYGNRVTVQHLMDNSSGLPREFTLAPRPEITLSDEDIVAIAGVEPLAFEPGSESRYSNVGYALLYIIIGEVTGGTFEDYARTAFFEPLGMDGSGGHFRGQRGNLTAYAYGHELEDDGAITPILDFQDEELRPGTLYTTASDLLTFGEYLRDAPFAGQLVNDRGVIAHAGGADGKRAYVETDQGAGTTFAFLTNYDAIPFGQTVTDLRAMMAGEDVTIPAAVNRTAVDMPLAVLRRYTGTYRFAEIENLEFEIRLVDGKLTVFQDGENNGALEAESDGVFFPNPQSAESFTFVTGEDGETVLLMDWQGVQWRGERIS